MTHTSPGASARTYAPLTPAVDASLAGLGGPRRSYSTARGFSSSRPSPSGGGMTGFLLQGFGGAEEEVPPGTPPTAVEVVSERRLPAAFGKGSATSGKPPAGEARAAAAPKKRGAPGWGSVVSARATGLPKWVQSKLAKEVDTALRRVVGREVVVG